MMGTSILSMPWGVERAGLVVGSFLILLMGGLCLYTTYCNLRTHQQFGSVSGEISELARSLLGPYAEVISKIFSLVVLLGANIVYWILMTNFLYHSVTYVYGSLINDEVCWSFTVLCPKLGINDENELMRENLVFRSVWNLKTVPIFLSFIIVPLLNFKSPTFFTKFNSFGTLSIVYLIVFVLIKVSVWGIRVDSVDPSSPAYSPLASVSFPATSGMLALSYFVHNIIITIMRNNSNQKNNVAYGLVTLTYLLIGVMFYIAFPLLKSCIQDNLLDNFSGSDMLTVIARLFLLFQLVTVFPLIAYMLRVQTLIALTGRAYPATSYVLGHNLVLVIVCVLFAIFLPRIGTIIRFTGALSGLVHVFALPCVLRLAAQYKNGKVPPLSWIIHIVIPLFGAANLIAQFFVADD
ncbi:hypothetical protein AAG570_004364 [Ranatra chinensis]|uniref:Amino acid transporter transmembrane domain-containing protein n=1 Tax=Ranatra chinensis TaxID=642074 RepID=A0ABD0Y0P9_9HEMI